MNNEKNEIKNYVIANIYIYIKYINITYKII